MANLEGEWLTGNQKRTYPLVDGDLDVVSDKDLQLALVDAYIVLNARSASDSSAQIKLSSVTQTTLVLLLATGDTVTFTGGAATVSDDSKFATYRWSNQNYGAATLVFSRSHADVAAGAFSFIMSTPHEFDSRCAEIQPARVDQIALDIGGTPVSIGEIGELVEGYNISLEANPETARTSLLDIRRSTVRPLFNRIVLTAKPGLGMGKNPTDCGAASGDILTINHKTPNQGDFQLRCETCYRISRPSGVVVGDAFSASDNTLKVSNDCQACCDCDDFVALLNEIRRLKNEGLAIKTLLDGAKQAFIDIKQLWALKVACIGTRCRAQVYAYAYTGWKVQVLVWIGNPENCAKPGSTIDVEFTGGNWDPFYVPGSGMVYNSENQYSQQDPTESGGVYTMQDNNIINGGGYVVYTFTVRMRPSASRVAGATVNINVTATTCDAAPEELNAVVELLGNVAKP